MGQVTCANARRASQSGIMKVEISPKDLITKRTDNRGRLTLGSEYANQEVTVIVAEVEE